MRKIIFFLLLTGCSLGGQQYNPNSPTPGTGGGGSPGNLPPVSSGGELGPPPSNAPANSLATTTGGYVTLLQINQNPIDSSESFIGATATGNRAIFLFQRSPSRGIQFWDVFEMSSSGTFKQDCSIPIPAGSSGTFNGITYDGTQIQVLNSNYISGFSLFSLDPDSCATASTGTLYSSSEYFFSGSIPFSYYGGLYYLSLNNIFTINPSTSIVSQWTYGTQNVSGISATPDSATFALTSGGAFWFVDSAYNLWLGNNQGNWIGWTELPFSTYSDLTQVRSIFSFGTGDLRVVTLAQGSASSTLRVYQIDVSHF